MDLKIFLLFTFALIAFKASTTQARTNRKQQLDSQFYSQLLADLSPSYNAINNYDYVEPNLIDYDYKDDGVRRPRHEHRTRYNLCSSVKVQVDLTNHPIYEFLPNKYWKVSCKHEYSLAKKENPLYKSEKCHSIKGLLGETGCFNDIHDEFFFYRNRTGPYMQWELGVREISDCRCMYFNGK